MNPLVLIIDDDPAITDMLSVLLRANGFDTALSNTGSDGLRMIRDYSPRIVIVDLMMPDLDGWQIARAAREFTSIPILILSALDEPSIVASVLDQGADDFLAKPFSSAVLLARLNKLLRRTQMLHRFPHDRAHWRAVTSPLYP
jgi:two-component system, OmpR family, response regulator MtrA